VGTWPQIRGIIRDLAAIAVGLYIVWRTANPPPITAEDVPGFVIAGGFLGVPVRARASGDGGGSSAGSSGTGGGER